MGSHYIKIGIAMNIALLIIFMMPNFLKTGPHIPTQGEIEMYTQQMRASAESTFATITNTIAKNITFSYQASIQTAAEQITPTGAQGNYWEPTKTPILKPFQTPPIIPSVIITHSSVVKPTIQPTRIIYQSPTLIPTKYIPPSPPKVKPTIPSQPSPTVAVPTPIPTVKALDYTKIKNMVANPPQIGCRGGTTSGCPVNQLYNTLLDRGLGWATYYGDEHASGYNVVADVIHNRKGISMDSALSFINETYMVKQSDLTPDQARATGKVIAYGATRGPADLWTIKYMFGIDSPSNPQPYFIGRVMIIDMAAPQDWSGRLATLTYGYKGWNSINWIADLSKNGFVQIPTGYSGQQDNVREGRPGVVLIDESVIDQYIY